MQQAENGLQLQSSENGKTAVWHYGLKLQWYLTGERDWSGVYILSWNFINENFYNCPQFARCAQWNINKEGSKSAFVQALSIKLGARETSQSSKSTIQISSICIKESLI